MQAKYKKEYLIIILIFMALFVVGLYSSLHDRPEYSKQAGPAIVLPPRGFYGSDRCGGHHSRAQHFPGSDCLISPWKYPGHEHHLSSNRPAFLF